MTSETLAPAVAPVIKLGGDDFRPTNVAYTPKYRYLPFIQGILALLALLTILLMPVMNLVFDTFEIRRVYNYLHAFSLPAEANLRSPVYPSLVSDGILLLICAIIGLAAALVVILVRKETAIKVVSLLTMAVGVVMFLRGVSTRISPLPVRGYGLAPGGAPIITAVLGIVMAVVAVLIYLKRREMLGLIPD